MKENNGLPPAYGCALSLFLNHCFTFDLPQMWCCSVVHVHKAKYIKICCKWVLRLNPCGGWGSIMFSFFLLLPSFHLRLGARFMSLVGFFGSFYWKGRQTENEQLSIHCIWFSWSNGHKWDGTASVRPAAVHPDKTEAHSSKLLVW